MEGNKNAVRISTLNSSTLALIRILSVALLLIVLRALRRSERTTAVMVKISAC
jgi:hypothetical protein